MKSKKFPAVAVCGLVAVTGPALAQDDEQEQVDEIVVTALPLGKTVEALTQPTTVLSGDDLARSQDISLGETIADELGVSSTYFGPVASRPVIRGQAGERVQVLSNGLDSLDVSALSEDHAVTIDNLLADHVEIVRGPATLIYGSSAAAGIVNVVDSRIHTSPLESDFSGAVSVTSDSALGSNAGAAKIDFGDETFIGHFDFMRRSSDDVEIPGFAESAILRQMEAEEAGEEGEEEENEGFIENSASETESSAFGFSLLGSGDNFLGFSVSNYETNYGLPGGHGHEHGEEHDEDHDEDHGDEDHGEEHGEEEEEVVSIDLEQTRYEVRGQLGLGGFFDAARLSLAHTDYEHTEFEGAEVGTVYQNEGTDIRIDLLQKESDVLAGTVGLHYKELDFDAVGEEAFVPPSDSEQLGIYAFQEWTVSDRLVLQGSARFENQTITTADFPEYDESAFGASVGTLFDLTDTLVLSANLALTERHPNSTELYANGPHVAVERFERGSVTLGNGVLDKETSTNIDVTLRGDYDRFTWAVTAFHNDVSDYILLSPTAEEEDGFQVFDFRQSDAELYGLEAEALFDIINTEGRHLHARVFGDFVHAEEDNGNYLPRITPMRLGASLHFAQDQFDASVSVVNYSEQEKVALNELPTDSYTMVDAELSYRFGQPNMLVYLRGLNLGDEDARRHTSPLKDVAPLPGRSIRLGLRMDF